MKIIAYVAITITGLLILKFGIGNHNSYQNVFAYSMIGLGVFNTYSLIMKKRKERNEKNK